MRFVLPPCGSVFSAMLAGSLLSGCADDQKGQLQKYVGQETVIPVDGRAPPNILIIFADDMGYGDIKAYNAESLVPTPNLDQLAKDGLRFTDAHTSSAVCTSSRYSLLTGRYAWRTHLKSGVLRGYSPLLIEPETETIASRLKDQGYSTASIGKWHLGLGSTEAVYSDAVVSGNRKPGEEAAGNTSGLVPGPNDVGFDYFFGIPASLDMPPYVFLENGRLDTQLSHEIESNEARRNGGTGYWRKGLIAKGFEHEKVLPELTERALDFIRERGTTEYEDKPFFLYFALSAPHTPWLPTESFRGKSGAGHYGDFAHQVDHVVGQVSEALDQAGLSDNTLVIFSSDNGAHWRDVDIQKFGHFANGELRGQKADIYEGGHRVPLIIRWPGRTPESSVSEQPLVLTDLMATIMAITGADPGEAGVDSFDMSPIITGQATEPVQRAPLIHHSYDGTFAIRSGDWKLILGLGSGGFTEPKYIAPIEGGPAVQLYNLKEDISESRDLSAEHPDVVQQLSDALSEIQTTGRSR